VTDIRAHRSRAWLVWALGAASFGYAFFQRVTPSVMVSDLMREFQVGAAILGNLSAVYFYAYAGLQIPVGLMLDRWGPRRMLTIAAAVAAVGSLLFALAHTITAAYLGRLLIGMGSAVGFVGTLKLAAHWFPPNRYAFLGGMTMLVAMIGGVGGQAPLAFAVAAVGWRGTVLAAAAFGAVLALLTWVIVRDRPPGDPVPEARTVSARSLAADLGAVLRSRQNWAVAVYGGCMSGPMLAYAGLWGVPHLMEAYALERPVAAGSASLMLIGWAVGAPAGGWISDHLGRRKLPMAMTAGLGLIGWLALLYAPGLPIAAAWGLLFATGAVSGGMVVCMAVARELVPVRLSGATTGFVNTANVGAGAVLQPFIGFLLDLNWDGFLLAGARVYSVGAYHVALAVLPGCALVALLMALSVRETWCRPLGE